MNIISRRLLMNGKLLGIGRCSIRMAAKPMRSASKQATTIRSSSSTDANSHRLEYNLNKANTPRLTTVYSGAIFAMLIIYSVVKNSTKSNSKRISKEKKAEILMSRASQIISIIIRNDLAGFIRFFSFFLCVSVFTIIFPHKKASKPNK